MIPEVPDCLCVWVLVSGCAILRRLLPGMVPEVPVLLVPGFVMFSRFLTSMVPQVPASLGTGFRCHDLVVIPGLYDARGASVPGFWFLVLRCCDDPWSI